uniref:Small nuclear RNA activating complex, polypeptide 1b n=1 Tax=Monopterus albus TaxID=43700 RepID=A0A3Q3IK28_MONAL
MESCRKDVEKLLACFQQAGSVRYQVFSAIWREMGFSDIFRGICGTGEMKRFCRVTLATAMKYFLPPYSYQIRVGGLYLMFGFYHTQLAMTPVKIRLALKDWDQVQTFVKDSVDAGHHDVVYIYKKLVATKAIHYTAMPHFLTFQKQRKPKREPLCAEFLMKSTAVQELISADLLEELTHIQRYYDQLKETTVEVSSQVNIVHRDFASRLKDCVSEFTAWQQKSLSLVSKDKTSGADEERPAEDESSSNRARLLSSIKHKSYSSFQDVPKSRRHRQAETVDFSGSEAEQVPPTVLQRRKHISLRARTWRSLGVVQERSRHQDWLLSTPDTEDKVPVKRTSHVVPYKL